MHQPIMELLMFCRGTHMATEELDGRTYVSYEVSLAETKDLPHRGNLLVLRPRTQVEWGQFQCGEAYRIQIAAYRHASPVDDPSEVREKA